MPESPRRLLGTGVFQTEWNKIPDWFQFLATEYISTDGSIQFDISDSGVILRANKFETLRYVQLDGDIEPDDEGEASKLKFEEDQTAFDLMDPEHKFTVGNHLAKWKAFQDVKHIVGRFRDNRWEVIPTNTIVHGSLEDNMERGETISAVEDFPCPGLIREVFDPGQIPSSIRVLSGSTVTYVRETGILISFDCDSTEPVS